MSGIGSRGKPRRGQNEEISRQAAASERADIHTNLPGEIVSFDPATQTATVKIQYVPKINGEETPYPELLKVPVNTPRGGGFAMSIPTQPGDLGMLVFAERDLSSWYEEGGDKAGDSTRMHDLSDAVFIPGGMMPSPDRLESFNAQNFEVRTVDGQYKIEMSPDGKFAMVGAQGDIVSLLRDLVELLSTDQLVINYGSSAGSGHELQHRAAYAEILSKLNAMVIS